MKSVKSSFARFVLRSRALPVFYLYSARGIFENIACTCNLTLCASQCTELCPLSLSPFVMCGTNMSGVSICVLSNV